MAAKNAWLIAGLGYGDEGKGSITDYLARRENIKTVVRYNGGAQAGHRVVNSDGQEHIFAQFGSGTMIPGVLTHLSRFMLVEPMGMLAEYEHLKSLGFADAFERITIEEEAPIITPFHIAANRLLELSRDDERYGSCGLGIGETMEDLIELGADALFIRDLKDVNLLRKKLIAVRERKLLKIRNILNLLPATEHSEENKTTLEDPETIEWCLEVYGKFIKYIRLVKKEYLKSLLRLGNILFEGGQGMLLDRTHGFCPYITKTDITFRNAMTLLAEAGYGGPIIKAGVIRGYLTRHGRGPFITEDEKLLLTDISNKEHVWQGKFRIGWFDLLAIKYGLSSIGGVDFIALTNLDRLTGLGKIKVCTSYKHDEETISSISAIRKKALTKILFQCQPNYLEFENFETQAYVNFLEKELSTPIKIISFSPTAEGKITI